MTDRAPFRSTAAALAYLFNPERVACDRSAASRLADKYRAEPSLLAGLDGAATAARAASMLEGRLRPLHLHILAARYAPSRIRCDCRSVCCSGTRPNPAWTEAVRAVALEAMSRALADCDGHLRYVLAVLTREYGGEKLALTDIGTELGMSLGACTSHKRRVLNWLLHIPDGRERGKDEPPAPPPGQEVEAMKAADEVLMGAGLVENT